MDSANLAELRQQAMNDQQRAKVRLLREFEGGGDSSDDLDIPDPYYGAGDGFERVLDMAQASCAGLLAQISAGELV
jgi:protein-tyrosine phosphatase